MNIQTKIITLTVLVTTVVLGAFTSYFIFEQNKVARQELNLLAQTVAERLAKQSALAFWELDKDQVNELLVSEMGDRRIKNIVINDLKKNSGVFAKAYTGIKRDISWQPRFSDSALKADQYYSSKKIAYKGTDLGTVAVSVSDRFLKAQTQEQLVNVVVGVVILDCVLLILLFIVLRFLIVKPLSKLKVDAEKIAAGDFDVAIKNKSQDEIGQVGQAIDLLKLSLKMSMDRLKAA